MNKAWLMFLLIPSLVLGQIQLPLAVQTPPEGTSHQEMMHFLEEIIPQISFAEMEVAGSSHEKREIPVVYLPTRKEWASDASTVMIFAQQHGDEPSGKEALLMLLHQMYRTSKFPYPQLNLILLPMVNPDGNEKDQRRNAREVDLNRNHLILTEPETRILHQLFLKYQPHITLDVHEYGMQSWLKEGFIKDFGEQLDCISNPAIPPELKALALNQVLIPTLKMTRGRGVRANRYLITRPSLKQFVRHSTTDINDGRNGFGIRLTLSFILEGLNGRSKSDRIWERAKQQLTLIESFLEICNRNSKAIFNRVTQIRHQYASQSPATVPIQADYTRKSSQPLEVTLVRTSDLQDTVLTIQDYRPEAEIIQAVSTPTAYLISEPFPEIVKLLEQHQLTIKRLQSEQTFEVEAFEITGEDTLHYESRTTIIPAGNFKKYRKAFPVGTLLVPASGLSVNLVVQMLEPSSFYGLSHYSEFQGLLQGRNYPVYRLYLSKERLEQLLK